MRKTLLAFGLALLTSTSAFADTTPPTPPPTPETAPVTPVQPQPDNPPLDNDGPPIPRFCSLTHLPTKGGNFALPLTLTLAAIAVSLRRRRA